MANYTFNPNNGQTTFNGPRAFATPQYTIGGNPQDDIMKYADPSGAWQRNFTGQNQGDNNITIRKSDSQQTAKPSMRERTQAILHDPNNAWSQSADRGDKLNADAKAMGNDPSKYNNLNPSMVAARNKSLGEANKLADAQAQGKEYNPEAGVDPTFWARTKLPGNDNIALTYNNLGEEPNDYGKQVYQAMAMDPNTQINYGFQNWLNNRGGIAHLQAQYEAYLEAQRQAAEAQRQAELAAQQQAPQPSYDFSGYVAPAVADDSGDSGVAPVSYPSGPSFAEIDNNSMQDYSQPEAVPSTQSGRNARAIRNFFDSLGNEDPDVVSSLG